ncbi:MAG: Ribonuclease M5 [Firmicutes bacterium ADurb.Bin193]|nr:MAG: Ribonuclease M5 [Firmicutes bacterium ADurb.Bin193]
MSGLCVKEIIVVEGKYDKIRVSSAVDAVIITTDGFRLYRNKEKLDLLRRLAGERGIIILTDSDGAGFKIRNYLRSALGDVEIKNAYIPAIMGREKRKSGSAGEGLLGVEGMDNETIIKALQMAKATPFERSSPITKADFFEYGLAGGSESAKKRRTLAIRMGLPPRISANAMLEAVNLLYTRDEFIKIINSSVE